MIFYTLQNDKRPFQLNFKKQSGTVSGMVTVYKYNDEYEDDTLCLLPYKEFAEFKLTNNTTVFINSSAKPMYEATSVLIQTFDLVTQTYSFQLFSGDRAVSFVLPDNDYVSKFFAKITNDDKKTPQPLIVGHKNVYFMAQDIDKYLPKNMIVGQMTDKLWENLYEPFYGTNNTNSNTTSKLQTIALDMKGITNIEQQTAVEK